MKIFLRKFKHQLPLRSVLSACFGTLIVFAILTPAVFSAQFAYEYWTPRDTWFEYTKVVPVKSNFETGETLRFDSFAEFYKAGSVQWFDTLYCSDGEITSKYKTQIFPREVSEPIGRSVTDSDNKAWQYSEEKLDGKEVECKICGKVVFLTPNFEVKKNQNWGCSEWFDVNR